MSKKRTAILVSFPMLALLLWTILLEISLHNQREIWVQARGYDPRNLISGHYMLLEIDWEKTDCTQFKNNVCPIKEFENSYKYYLSEKDAVNLENLGRKCNMELKFTHPKNMFSKPMLTELRICGKIIKNNVN